MCCLVFVMISENFPLFKIIDLHSRNLSNQRNKENAKFRSLHLDRKSYDSYKYRPIINWLVHQNHNK